MLGFIIDELLSLICERYNEDGFNSLNEILFKIDSFQQNNTLTCYYVKYFGLYLTDYQTVNCCHLDLLENKCIQFSSSIYR